MRLLRNLSYVIRPQIYVILRGGLGNQLHQIAAGVKFAEERGQRIAIFPHIVDTAKNIDRRGFFREIDLAGLFPGVIIRETNLVEDVVLRLLNIGNFRCVSRWIVSEDNFMNPLGSQFFLLRGWFQSFDYIPNRVNYLALRRSGKSAANQITVHVRLTDFLTIDSNPLGLDYYTNALLKLNPSLTKFDLRCYSDDMEKAKTMIPFDCIYDFPEKVKALSASELLSHLSWSEIIICSKSSLCWWAANSVSSSGGIVISPWEGSTHKTEWLRINS